MLKKGKKIKVIMALAIMWTIIWMGSTTVHAQSVGEVNPNDTKETAQLIQASKETAQQAAAGQRTDQYVVDGYTSLNDIDWYKVFLTKGKQYVTCNSFDYNFWVYDEYNNLLMKESYSRSSHGPRAYSFEVNADGYYYIKVQGILSSSESYILSVGDPTYAIAHCQVNLGSINMSNKNDYNCLIDLSDNDVIPEGAVVYDISLRGTRTSNASFATINNITQNTKITLGPSFHAYNIAAKNLKADSRWEITIGYKKDNVLNPKFIMYFVYPVYSEFLANDEIVINAY